MAGAAAAVVLGAGGITILRPSSQSGISLSRSTSGGVVDRSLARGNWKPLSLRFLCFFSLLGDLAALTGLGERDEDGEPTGDVERLGGVVTTK